MSIPVKRRIKEIIALCRKKSLTDAGRDRKICIVEKLSVTRIRTNILVNFYVATLPVFKLFISVFEQKQPMMHHLHDELKKVVRFFFACFVKMENLKGTASKLAKVDVSDKTLQKPLSTWFIGNKTKDIISKLR